MKKGKIIQFRRGRHTVTPRHFLVDAGAKDRAEAKNLIGKQVSWKSLSGKVITGVIKDAHGNKGLVRAIFTKGLPGQALTQEVEIH